MRIERFKRPGLKMAMVLRGCGGRKLGKWSVHTQGQRRLDASTLICWARPLVPLQLKSWRNCESCNPRLRRCRSDSSTFDRGAFRGIWASVRWSSARTNRAYPEGLSEPLIDEREAQMASYWTPFAVADPITRMEES